jgi:hypothetical protein
MAELFKVNSSLQYSWIGIRIGFNCSSECRALCKQDVFDAIDIQSVKMLEGRGRDLQNEFKVGVHNV